MIGAIVGDIIGSVYQIVPQMNTDFPLFSDHATFTDDTVLTVAVADSLLSGASYAEKLHKYARAYPDRGYGKSFWRWVEVKLDEPYYSWGNGSAMRVSPVGYVSGDLGVVLAEAKRSAEVTHNHPEGIKGAQATAAAIHLALSGKSKDRIRETIQDRFGYNLNRTIEEIRPTYNYNLSCQGTVPEAIIAFLDSDDYESAVRLSISLGGDADTLACITGGIAEAYYGGVPADIAECGLARLDNRLRNIVNRFCKKFDINFA